MKGSAACAMHDQVPMNGSAWGVRDTSGVLHPRELGRALHSCMTTCTCTCGGGALLLPACPRPRYSRELRSEYRGRNRTYSASEAHVCRGRHTYDAVRAPHHRTHAHRHTRCHTIAAGALLDSWIAPPAPRAPPRRVSQSGLTSGV